VSWTRWIGCDPEAPILLSCSCQLKHNSFAAHQHPRSRYISFNLSNPFSNAIAFPFASTIMFLRKTLIASLLASVQFAHGDTSFPPSELANIKRLQASSLATDSECACNILAKLFDNKLYENGSEIYKAESTHYWNARGTPLPRCVFVPTDPNEVAQAVVTLGLCKSQFAVRGGGHMPVRSLPGSQLLDRHLIILPGSRRGEHRWRCFGCHV